MITLLLRRALPSTIGENPLWLVVLCDMMTNLMLFFLVMYSFTMIEPSRRENWVQTFDARQVVEDPKEARARVLLKQFRERQAVPELLRQAQLADTADVSMTQHSIRVRLRDKVLFPSAQADLNPGVRESLGRLAKVLREMPNEVIVEGHTDDVPVVGGPFRTNWELSVARSYSVIERLLAEGVEPKRLIASGYGPHHPLADNKTEAGRSRNRRVEVVILRGPEDEP